MRWIKRTRWLQWTKNLDVPIPGEAIMNTILGSFLGAYAGIVWSVPQDKVAGQFVGEISASIIGMVGLVLGLRFLASALLNNYLSFVNAFLLVSGLFGSGAALLDFKVAVWQGILAAWAFGYLVLATLERERLRELERLKALSGHT
jgi:hypothetical protein